MTRFPDNNYSDAAAYTVDYFRTLAEASGLIDLKAIDVAAQTLLDGVKKGARIYCCGNGGSAAIADHLTCDFVKGVRTDTHLHPHVTSLVSTVSLVTAISNDIGYGEAFRFQLESLAKPGDILMAISSSGNSPNIVNAIDWAKNNSVTSIALTGFSGGKAAQMADVNILVPCNNYGIVEDLHQSIMHILAQYLRQSQMDDHAVRKSVF